MTTEEKNMETRITLQIQMYAFLIMGLVVEDMKLKLTSMAAAIFCLIMYWFKK